jgi:two-component system, OmpR family, response regulator ChvI
LLQAREVTQNKPITTSTNPLYNILVVDDEPDITTTLKIGLENKGFAAVDTFNDPALALSNFKPDLYDIVMLDIKMPALNGFELCQEIRKKDKKVKICFITGFELYYDQLKKDFPKLNVGCFIKKPMEIDNLVERIREELQSGLSQ